MGKIGYFQRDDTVALGNSQMGKLKRWRSGRSSKTENRRSKLSLDDISKPKDYKHIFHVGVDGKVEGDPTFGGDYRNIPKTDEEEGSSPSRSSSTSGRSDSKSSTPSKSPNKPKKNIKKNISAPVIELSKETILPPPNGFDSGSTVSVPDVVPSVTQQVSSVPPPIPSQPPQKAPIAVLAEPEITYTNGTNSTHNQDEKDGDLSLTPSFEMGSLLDDMMSVWDSAKLNLGFTDTLDPTPEEPDDTMEEEDSLLEGEENALCNGNTSLSPPNLSVGMVNPVAVEEMEAFGMTNGTEVREKREDGEPVNEEEELGAVGGASAALVSGGVSTAGRNAEGGILTGNIIIKDSMTKPTKTFRKVPRQTPSEEGDANEGMAKPESPSQEQSQAPRSRPGRDMNIARQMSREKRWDNEFKRLSSSPKDKSSDNEYVDTDAMKQKVDKSGEEYEELALASSPQPYTLRDSVLDSANVMRVPRYADVSRSISLRTTRSVAENSRVEVELNRSRSLREPPVSPLGQQAYDSLVGGDISGNLHRSRPDVPEKKPPVVPPKPAPKPPSRVKAPDSSGEGRFRNGEARLSGSSSQRSYSGTSSDDGMFEDNSNIQVASGDIAGKSGAVASLRQRFNTNQTEDAPPRPPPREPTDTKVSTFTGVRLRRREQTNGMNENFYASEPDNNNSFPSHKFSSTTLQNLEQHMPRRVRRPIGEDRIKRRNSSDASDSDTDGTKTRTERVWSTSSRASEGDSSSDETVGSNRLSTSSNERSSFSETQSSSGYKSPPRSLYDLPEDQTNSTSSSPTRPHSSEDHPTMDHRPPPLPPRITTDSTTTTHRKPPDRPPSGGGDAHWTRPPEAGGNNGDTLQNAVPPPRPVRYDLYDRLPRSRTVDMGEHALDSQKRASQFDYDILPVRRPMWTQNKSFSVDTADSSDDYMVGSAASMRQLLRQSNVSSNENVNNNHDDIDGDADNLEDMPDTSPPPIPTTRKSFIDSACGETLVQCSERQDTNAAPVESHSIREPDYVMMKPQSDQDVKREYKQLSSATSDYAVPVSKNYVSPNDASQNQNHAASPQLSNKEKALYLLMHPSSARQQSSNTNHNFTRTKSAHLVRRPAFLRASRPEPRRSTVSASTKQKAGDGDGSSSLPRSDRSVDDQGDGHRMRRSRSSDDILKDGDWTMPHEAESLQDLLARAYISPNDRRSTPDPRSGYLVPPSARRKLPSPDAHHLTTNSASSTSRAHPHPVSQTPPASTYHGEAAYLDMSQNSLERKKKREQEKAAMKRIEPVHTSSEHSSSSSPSLGNTTKPVSSTANWISYPPTSSSNQTKAVPSSTAAQHFTSRYIYDSNDDEVDL